MKIKKTKFKGLLILNGVKHQDKRGYLRELVVEKLIKKNLSFRSHLFQKKCFKRFAFSRKSTR